MTNDPEKWGMAANGRWHITVFKGDEVSARCSYRIRLNADDIRDAEPRGPLTCQACKNFAASADIWTIARYGYGRR